MKSLKVYKGFNIFILIVAYLAAILTACGFLQGYLNPDAANAGEKLVFIGIVFYIILFLLQIPSYIVTCVCTAMTEKSVAKYNMIMKIIYIPFFSLNLFSCICGITQNIEFSETLLIMPVVIAFLAFATYIVMFRISLSNILYFAKSYGTKKLKPTTWSIISLIMSFIFFLDVVASIILFKHEVNQQPEQAAKIKAKFLQRVEDWKVKKHMSLRLYKILSIIGSVIVFVSATLVFISAIRMFISKGEDIMSILLFERILPGFIVLFVASLYKLVVGIIYGKKGDENPINYIFVMKLIDIIPTVMTLIVSGIFFVLSIGSLGLFIFMMPFIVVIIFIFALIALILASVVAYLISLGLMTSSLLCIFGDTGTILTYLVNQRKVKNRKFLNKAVIACFVLLWFPVLNIPALFVLRRINKKNGTLFSETPVVEKTIENESI